MPCWAPWGGQRWGSMLSAGGDPRPHRREDSPPALPSPSAEEIQQKRLGDR